MDISSVGPIRPNTPFPVETDKQVTGPQTFGELLNNAVNVVNDMQIDADNKSLQLALGEIEDTHEVMLAMQKASMSLQLTMEIRNKVIEAYQEILRQAM
jgi:flagellar hook-basal body complex protein FliE